MESQQPQPEEGSESTPAPQSPQSQDTINENNNQQQTFPFTMIESINTPTPTILSLNQLLQNNNQQNTENVENNNNNNTPIIKSESTQIINNNNNNTNNNNNNMPPQFSGFSCSPHHYHYPHHHYHHNPYSLQNPFQPITLRYGQPIQFPPPPPPFANNNNINNNNNNNNNQIIMFPSMIAPQLNELINNNNKKNKKEINETDIFGIGKKRKRGYMHMCEESSYVSYASSSSSSDVDVNVNVDVERNEYEPNKKKMNLDNGSGRLCCRYCNKSFVQNCHLSRHIREKHASCKPSFECRICSKTFNQRSNLKVHLRSHALDESVSRPWLCIECYPNRRFTRKSSLKRHWLKKHKTLSKKLISQLDTNIKYETSQTTNIKNEKINESMNESIQQLRFDNGIYRIGDIEIPPQVFIQQNNSNNLPPLLDN